MSNALNNMYNFRRLRFILPLFIYLSLGNAYGSDDYYNNILVGGRAASMGGTYIAISDDAAGSYYNPAGIAYSFSDSVSGSGNAYHVTKTKYKKAIGNGDWDRESSALLPNFFGIVKKLGETTSLAFSYVVPDSVIEHQDQVYTNPLSTVEKFYISLHSEDTTYLAGPSLSYAFSDSFSLGMTLFYYSRQVRKQESQMVVEATSDSNSPTEFSYSSLNIQENGYVTKFGFQWNPFDPVTIGGVYSQSELISGSYNAQSYQKEKASTDGTLNTFNGKVTRKFPTQLSLGIAYFPTPYLLIATDFNYFQSPTKNKQNVLNYSLGTEYYWNNTNAFRFGYFTNNTNEKIPTASTNGPHEYMNLVGYSAGYTSYSRSSSLTFGGIYSSGEGEARPYGNTEKRNFSRSAMTLIMAASYNY